MELFWLFYFGHFIDLLRFVKGQACVVRKEGDTIHWINHYVDSMNNTYPLDSDLSSG